MKKMLASGMLCLLLLCGCGRSGKPLFDPVYFYYPRTEFLSSGSDSVITWEAMDGTGHMEDYRYLMAEYFAGPIDEGLYNPFPQGTELLRAWVDQDTFFLELSTEALTMPEHWFTLGCSCLSMTCFELTPVQFVCVNCGQKEITIRRDGILLYDDFVPPQETITEESK